MNRYIAFYSLLAMASMTVQLSPHRWACNIDGQYPLYF